MSATVSLPAPQVSTGPDGIKTIISYYLNQDGKKVKVTQKLREVDTQEQIKQAIASRRQWAKYGLEKDSPPGASNETTALDEDMQLRLFPKSVRPDENSEEAKAPKRATVFTEVRCRTCGGAHYTSQCPYKDRLGGLPSDPAAAPAAAAAAPAAGTPGKYQPPTLRGREGPGFGAPRNEERDDLATLRVSNLPENVDEKLLRDVFSRAGRLTRSHVAKDKNTGQGRGFAFFSYETRGAAEEAQRMLDGKAIGHLVMRVEFAKK